MTSNVAWGNIRSLCSHPPSVSEQSTCTAQTSEMVDYYYHNRDEGSLFLRVRTPGEGWEDDQYVLKFSLYSPSYTFHKCVGEEGVEDPVEISDHPRWRYELTAGADVTFVLYYYSAPAAQNSGQQRVIRKEDRRIMLGWNMGGGWYGTISSRVYPRRENVIVHLDYAPHQRETEE